MSGTIKPVMEAVKMFSESLEPFMGLTTNAKDQAPTKDDYLCLQDGVIKQMAEGIANAFTSFISIIADEFTSDDNKKKYESLLKISETIKKVMEKIKKIVKSFSDIIKSMAGMTNNENETQGNINAEIYGGDFNGNMPQMQSS
jgi:phage-related protein